MTHRPPSSPTTSPPLEQYAALRDGFQWLHDRIQGRLLDYFQDEQYAFHDLPMPAFGGDTPLERVIQAHRMSSDEVAVLLLALAPHVLPHLLDPFFTKNKTYDRSFSEFGGQKEAQHRGFLPTGETACFLLAGNDLSRRIAIQQLFDREHFFSAAGILKLEGQPPNEPYMSGILTITHEYRHRLLHDTPYRPPFSAQFPAELVQTQLTWSDLVLPDATFNEVQDILLWLQYNDTLMTDWGMARQLKRGYRTLFYGPPGTGKTLTAALLGAQMQMDVYRIDLSQVVSKYIGETEKNMGSLFDQAENKQWILFFDEADALFGSRTATSDAKDRYANQEVAFLLQRIEDYPGVVILASNLKSNIDEAFARRFQSMILFPMPDVEQRERLWRKAFSPKSALAADVDLHAIAQQYELAGGAITNVVRYASLRALGRRSNVIFLNDIIRGIKRELKKEGKTV